MLVIAGVPAALIMLQPDLGTLLVLSATVFGVLAVAGAPRRWLVLAGRGRSDGGAVAAFAGAPAQALPGRPVPGLHQPRPRPPRRGLQHRAGPDRGRQRRPVRPGAVPRLADALRLRARAAHRLHLHRRRRGARPGRGRRADRAARRGDLARAGHLRAVDGRVRPGRRGRHRLLVRLPGLPEHRHVPGHHAGDRRTPALRLVRRQLDVRRRCSPSGCCRTSTCARPHRCRRGTRDPCGTSSPADRRAAVGRQAASPTVPGRPVATQSQLSLHAR